MAKAVDQSTLMCLICRVRQQAGSYRLRPFVKERRARNRGRAFLCTYQ